MTYESFRQFADSWGLVYMVVIFAVVVMLVLLPGAKKKADDAAQIPFREDR
jgi:cytochrome c oxidase cbb3-type subunit 4